MRISQSNRVSRIPTLSTHQIDHQADLQKSAANIHSRVDDNAFSCHEIDRKGGHDATPARMPRRLAQASPQAVRYEPVQLDEKGRRYPPCGSEWVGEASEVSHHRFLPSSSGARSNLNGPLQPYEADPRPSTGVSSH